VTPLDKSARYFFWIWAIITKLIGATLDIEIVFLRNSATMRFAGFAIGPQIPPPVGRVNVKVTP
jgi:hypothetical protein